MGVSFFESMHGTLRGADGAPHPVDFELKAEASDAGQFFRSGEARISGVVHAPPWAWNVAFDGTLRISLLRGREIAYRLRFCGVDGTRLELVGDKALSWRRPLATLTEMEASLSRVDGNGDGPIARGEMRLDLREIAGFFTSWRPGARIARVALPAAGRPEPSAPDDRRMRALADAIIEPTDRVPAADEVTWLATRSLLEHGLPGMARAYRLGLRTLDAAAFRTHGRGFADLDRDQRRAMLDRWAQATGPRNNHRGGVSAALLDALSGPIRIAHFSRPEFLERIEHPGYPGPKATPAPRYHDQVTTAEQLDAVTEVEADVAIVGTGAGGAALAARLSKAGLAVAMIEEGRFRHRHEFAGAPFDRMDAMWRNRGMQYVAGTPIFIPTGRVVGGTTTINSGTCFETPDAVLQQWRSDLGFPDDFSPERFERHSRRVRAALQVAPAGKSELGRIGDVLERGAETMGLGMSPLPRNAPGCTAAGVCIFGCPEGARRSADIAYVPDALKGGAALFTGLPVTRVLMHGRRAVAVEARGTDAHGVAKLLRVTAPQIVLACGSLATPILLRDNGFDLPGIGRNLSVHPAMGVLARFDEDLEPWRAIPQGCEVTGHAIEGLRYEGFYLPPSFVAGMLPWSGARLAEWMGDFRRIAQYGFVMRDDNRGRVYRGPGGLPVIRYTLSESIRDRIRAGSAQLSELYMRAGAREVFTNNRAHPIVRSVSEARALADVDVRAADLRLLGAHPLGTCAMGADPARAVVDFDHRVFGTDNLFIVDGSVVPTSLGVNPQMTIMALAHRAAERIAARAG